MRRLLPLLALLPLAACATVQYPLVVPGAFAPAPRKVAILTYATGLIGGGEFGVPIPVSDVATPYAAFKQALYASKRFLVAQDQLVGTNPLYLGQPVETIAGSLPPLMRPILFSPAAAPGLAGALGADVLLVVHNYLQVVTDSGFGPFAASHVQVTTRIEAYAPNGALVWQDRFWTSSPNLANIMGFKDPKQLQNVASQLLVTAGQNAVGRLTIALSRA